MDQPPLIVDHRLDQLRREDVLERRPALEVRELGGDVDELTAVGSPKALVTSNNKWRADYLDGLESGDWVTTIGSGFDRFPLDELAKRGIALTHAPGRNAAQVADHAFAMALSFVRDLWTYRTRQRDHEWKKESPRVTHLAGETCCIVGLGHVGEASARRASAFGMTVVGVKRTVDGYDGFADTVYAPNSILDALGGTRLVVIAVPLTRSTAGLVGRAELAATHRDAIIVNVGRGPVLETDSLIAALDQGTLGAACLDVTDPEPLPPESPLWDRSDVLVTPHVGWKTDKRTGQILDYVLPQYDRWRTGTSLEDRIV